VRSCGVVELEQNSSCAVALSCVTLVRRYLSLRSCLRSCGQVLGTPSWAVLAKVNYTLNICNLLRAFYPALCVHFVTTQLLFVYVSTLIKAYRKKIHSGTPPQC